MTENVQIVRKTEIEIEPCKILKYCPYGYLVEQFPLGNIQGDGNYEKNKNAKPCRIFGHDCPVFYVAEKL